jgi:hypothetical protein
LQAKVESLALVNVILRALYASDEHPQKDVEKVVIILKKFNQTWL